MLLHLIKTTLHSNKLKELFRSIIDSSLYKDTIYTVSPKNT